MPTESMLSDGPVRVAVVSTPRAGNTWLSTLLARAWRVPRHAYHVDNLDWAALPSECVFQIHLPAARAWRDELAAHGFRPVVIARHPLDVLVSILHFTRYEPEVLRWGDGAGGEELIVGAAPGDRRFLDYATGSRAAALLEISRFWWATPGAVGTRYEDLIANPLVELRRVLAATETQARSADLATDVAAAALPNLRARSENQHFWQGRPGLWRRLLVAADASAVVAAQPEAFQAFGYNCDPDPGLTADQAARNWLELTLPSWHDNARRLRNRQEYGRLARESAHWQERTRMAEEAWASADAECRRLRADVAHQQERARLAEEARASSDAECRQLRAASAELEALGPFAWSVARRVKQFTVSHPRLARMSRRLLPRGGLSRAACRCSRRR